MTNALGKALHAALLADASKALGLAFDAMTDEHDLTHVDASAA